MDALVSVKRCVKNAVHSFGASVVPLGDSALVEVPFSNGNAPKFDRTHVDEVAD